MIEKEQKTTDADQQVTETDSQLDEREHQLLETYKTLQKYASQHFSCDESAAGLAQLSSERKFFEP
ncbi:MAG: hypothetical protein NPIRA02_27510 [Nitrospirales bacterium]|nr:MAG: hypothetical protein NPIRA02_27510 [Nitrospirales bacterium]